MKKLTTFFLLTLACLLLPAAALAASFKDVNEGAYYAPAVKWAVSKGVTDGFSDGTFRPDATCTRGQVVTFIWRADGKPEPTKTANPFTDVEATSPFYKAILWACEKGITNGTSATTFNPSGTCTRGQIVTFIWRANGQPSASGNSTLAAGYDSGAYYKNAVAWADSLGLLGGTGTPFKPGDACPRADVVTYLYRNTSDGVFNRSKIYTLDYDKWEASYNWNGTSECHQETNNYETSILGDKLYHIQNSVPNHAMVTQVVTVKPHMDYKFESWMYIKDYKQGEQAPGGACIAIYSTDDASKWSVSQFVTSFEHSTVDIKFNSGDNTSICLCLSNGWYGAVSEGLAHFVLKNTVLEELGTNEASPLFE